MFLRYLRHLVAMVSLMKPVKLLHLLALLHFTAAICRSAAQRLCGEKADWSGCAEKTVVEESCRELEKFWGKGSVPSNFTVVFFILLSIYHFLELSWTRIWIFWVNRTVWSAILWLVSHAFYPAFLQIGFYSNEQWKAYFWRNHAIKCYLVPALPLHPIVLKDLHSHVTEGRG